MEVSESSLVGNSRVSTGQIRKSCDVCSRAKKKCDGNIPCMSCIRWNMPCKYSTKLKPGPNGTAALLTNLHRGHSAPKKKQKTTTSASTTISTTPQPSHFLLTPSTNENWSSSASKEYVAYQRRINSKSSMHRAILPEELRSYQQPPDNASKAFSLIAFSVICFTFIDSNLDIRMLNIQQRQRTNFQTKKRLK